MNIICKLTARQIKMFDEFVSDEASAKETLEIALNYHANMQSQIRKNRKEFWNELGEIHSFDHESSKYWIRRIDGAVVITDEGPTDNED